MYRLLKTIILSLFISLSLSCSKPEPIKIGFIGALSGRAADLGIGGRNGVQMAIEEINLKGGVNGRPLELLMRDDQQNRNVALNQVHDLQKLGVKAIIGPMTSSIAVTIAPYINEAKLVTISPTATTPDLSGKKTTFFESSQITVNMHRKVPNSNLRNAIYVR